jgi:hypothetical protein
MSDLPNCVLQKCASDCTGGDNGAGSGGDTGSGGSSTGATPGTGATGTGATGSGATGSTGGGTCNDLKACCTKVRAMAAQAGDSCDMIITAANGNDAICGAALTGLQSVCP